MQPRSGTALDIRFHSSWAGRLLQKDLAATDLGSPGRHGS